MFFKSSYTLKVNELEIPLHPLLTIFSTGLSESGLLLASIKWGVKLALPAL